MAQLPFNMSNYLVKSELIYLCSEIVMQALIFFYFQIGDFCLSSHAFFEKQRRLRRRAAHCRGNGMAES